MNIELHAPPGKVKELLFTQIKEWLIQLHIRDKEICRADVTLKESIENGVEIKFCEIHLTIYGESLFARREGATYEKAFKKVQKELNARIDRQVISQKDLPVEITSTVDI
jgi:hypothetical protein